MPVRFYSFEDAGAPAVSNLSTTRKIDNIKQILKACLVDGYGSKPGAGWTIGHEHADGISFGNGLGFINFVNAVQYTVAVYLMESITDGSTALASGANRRSGSWYDGQATTNRLHFYTNFAASTANKGWFVVADERTVTLFLTAGHTAANPTTSYSNAALHFGEFRTAMGTQGFICIGGGYGATSISTVASYSIYSAPAGMCLRNPLTGLVEQGPDATYGGAVAPFSNTGSPSTAYRVQTVDELFVSRVAIRGVGSTISGSTSASQNMICGRLRGLVYCPELADRMPTVAMPTLGVTVSSWLDRMRPFTGPAGKQWVLLSQHSSDATLFVSLDPDDWV